MFSCVIIQVETLKFTVERTATDLEGMRRQVNELKKEVEEKKGRWVILVGSWEFTLVHGMNEAVQYHS